MQALSNFPQIIDVWYNWGVAIAFAVTFVATLWIFFDSQSNGYQAMLWRGVSLLAAIVVIPSVILSFSPQMAVGLPQTMLNLLAVLGLIATGVALLTLLLYSLGIKVIPADEDSLRAVDPTPPFADMAQGAPASSAHITPREKSPTPPQSTPPGNDTIRIKSAYENAMPLAWVVALNGPYTGQEYRLQKITDIGREKEHTDVTLDDRTISRQHARIRYEKGAFVIYDLASANGVFVNGVQVQRRALAHGDRIKLGQVLLGVMMVQEETEPDDSASTPASETIPAPAPAIDWGE